MNCPKKIYFYFIIFYYILKNPLYIHKNPFLNKIKNNILNITNNNINNIPKDIQKILLNKLEFIITNFFECDNYFNKPENYYAKSNINIMLNNFNKNEIRNDPYSIILAKDSSTCMTFKSSKNPNENSPKKIKKNIIDEIKNCPILNDKINIYDNFTFIDFKKIKLEKNINNGNFILYFIEEIISEKLLLEDYNYEQFFYYCLSNKKCGTKFIPNKSKKGFKINENIVINTYNSYFKGEEDKLIIYNKTLQSKLTEFKDYSFPFGFNGFVLINNKILICPCKHKQKEESGFFYIVFIDNDWVNSSSRVQQNSEERAGKGIKEEETRKDNIKFWFYKNRKF